MGWLLNGDKRTVELPRDKAEAYTDEVEKLMRKKIIPLACFCKIVGKLRFAALCLPVRRALMTPLNMVMHDTTHNIRWGKKADVHESLGDWLQLIKELGSRPTSVHKIVATSVDYYGYCNTCQTGAGGV